MENEQTVPSRHKTKRKITPSRLKNIALYYLERFDSSAENLRQVLKRRVIDYAHYEPAFDVAEASGWIESIIADFERLGYLNDQRYAEFRIAGYLAAGKPERYIRLKMRQKGINDEIADKILSEAQIDEEGAARNFARKKKIGPFRQDEEKRRNCRQKDLAAMVRAGFDYEIAKEIIDGEIFAEDV